MLNLPNTLRSLFLLSLLLQATCATSPWNNENHNPDLPTHKSQLNQDEIVEKIKPATVSILSQPTFSMGSGPIIPHWQIVPQATLPGGGSGTIITPSGYVITTSAIIVTDSPLQLTIVTTNTGKRYFAKFIMRNEDKNLALLKLRRLRNKRLPCVQFGNDKNLRYKDKVFSLGYTISPILGKKKWRCYSGEYLKFFDFTAEEDYWLVFTRKRKRKGFIRHGAAVFTGMSGGPLVDSDGNLLGINSASSFESEVYWKNKKPKEQFSAAVPLSDVKVFLRASGIPELQELAK